MNWEERAVNEELAKERALGLSEERERIEMRRELAEALGLPLEVYDQRLEEIESELEDIDEGRWVSEVDEQIAKEYELLNKISKAVQLALKLETMHDSLVKSFVEAYLSDLQDEIDQLLKEVSGHDQS